nr:MAG TPA: hypothetical protein [Caudoviricetes sp.]
MAPSSPYGPLQGHSRRDSSATALRSFTRRPTAW